MPSLKKIDTFHIHKEQAIWNSAEQGKLEVDGDPRNKSEGLGRCIFGSSSAATTSEQWPSVMKRSQTAFSN